MFFPPELTGKELTYWRNAVGDRKRAIHVRLRLYDNDGKAMGVELPFLEGEVVADRSPNRI